MAAIRLANTAEIPREDWLNARRGGIGGSDAPAILGLDRYRSPFDVYADKLGLKPEQEDNEAMRQGRDLEQYVAERFMEATGKKVRRRNGILQHPEHPWMIANIDRWVVGEFQSTHPCGVRLGGSSQAHRQAEVSIHAPLRGATKQEVMP